MVFLARLGAIEALMGFMVGVWLWKALDKGFRNVAVFLGLSGALGITAAALRIAGHQNAWVGGLWEFVIISTLFNGLVAMCARPSRNVAKLIQLFAVFAWFAYFVFGGRLPLFSGGFHSFVCVIGMALSALVITNREASSGSLLVASITISLMGIDIFPNAASCDWLGSKLEARTFWTIRNAVWCAGYAAYAYSFRFHGKPVDMGYQSQ